MKKILLLLPFLITAKLGFSMCYECATPIMSNAIDAHIPFPEPSLGPAPYVNNEPPVAAPATVRFNPVVEVIPNLLI